MSSIGKSPGEGGNESKLLTLPELQKYSLKLDYYKLYIYYVSVNNPSVNEVKSHTQNA